jgi:integrase
MEKVSRYQMGSSEKVKTKLGLCWYIRFTLHNGKKGPRIRVGLVSDLPTKKAFNNAVADLRKDFNERALIPEQHNFSEVVHKYIREELPKRYSTARGYQSYLENQILPKWGPLSIEDVKAKEVRGWLNSLNLSTKTKGHIRNIMRILFRFAMLWEWIPVSENPMTLFRLEGSTKRRSKPRVLTFDEFTKLLAAVGREPYRTMMIVSACLGLRCSEVFGLRWEDLDWHARTLTVQRGIVDGRIDDVKTAGSHAKLPLHPRLLREMLQFYSRAEFKDSDDWVFASPFTAGERPYHSYRVQQYVIKPAAIACGLGDGIGWHTLRHSYRSWLQSTGTPIGVQKDLMRHADIRTTMNIYGGSYIEDLRKANDGVVEMLLP